jgi:hypothetical protein
MIYMGNNQQIYVIAQKYFPSAISVHYITVSEVSKYY